MIRNPSSLGEAAKVLLRLCRLLLASVTKHFTGNPQCWLLSFELFWCQLDYYQLTVSCKVIVLAETSRAVSHSLGTIFRQMPFYGQHFAHFASSRCIVCTLVKPWVCYSEWWSTGLFAHRYLETGESDCIIDQAFTMHVHNLTQWCVDWGAQSDCFQ